jgi:SAM-dependent methyltransferase
VAVPKGHHVIDMENGLVSGPLEHFLLVPKNRYRLTRLPNAPLRIDHGIGWVTEDNTPDAYDALWGDPAAIETFTAEADGIRKTLTREIGDATVAQIPPSAAVVDIGCGAGDLLEEVRSRAVAPLLSGCDFSPKAVDQARRRFPGDFVVHVINKTLPYPDKAFDAVYCTDVIEHLEHPAEIVSELVRICRPGGFVAIVIPDGAVDTFFGHLWFWTERSFPEFLSKWGASVSRLPVSRELIGLIRIAQ